MNILFLDFDGVVNTPMWELKNGKYECQFGWPRDGKVNNWQAIQWVSEFCQEFDYSIVISSTWRIDGLKRCVEYLRNGGLRDGVNVIGITPCDPDGYRGREISMWLIKHPEVTNYVIFDDDGDIDPHMDHLVQCRYDVGFMEDEWNRAKMIHQAFCK